MYEGAWAYYKQENYGERSVSSLGDLTVFHQLLHSEAYVIQGITYFVNCQWDRVRRAVETYKATYSPVSTSLGEYLDANKETAKAYYEDVVSLVGAFLRRWRAMFVRVTSSANTTTCSSILSGNHAAWLKFLSGLARVWLMTSWHHRRPACRARNCGGWLDEEPDRLACGFVKQFESQIDLIDLEVSEAEVTWLDAGRETERPSCSIAASRH